jgi:hypothetical protein
MLREIGSEELVFSTAAGSVVCAGSAVAAGSVAALPLSVAAGACALPHATRERVITPANRVETKRFIFITHLSFFE